MLPTSWILATALQAAAFRTARFVEVSPPIVFQAGIVTTSELEPIDPGFDWDQAIVSWNVQPASPASLKIEARVAYPDRTTKWYDLAEWSLEGDRHSVDGQADADGTVLTDTLSMNRKGGKLQLRVTGNPAPADPPKLTLLGISFCDTSAPTEAADDDRTVYGKVLAVPVRRQNDYPGGAALCSPTTVSMLLWNWSGHLIRPDLDQDVPAIQAGVWDPVYKGAGNWPFNMAYAGSFEGLVAYVDRFGSIRELEDWIAAGIPVGCSVSYQLIQGKPLDRATEQGHLLVLIGFSGDGDPIFNDPASKDSPKTYPRSDFLAAWEYSHRTVYLIYPMGAAIPRSELGRWIMEPSSAPR